MATIHGITYHEIARYSIHHYLNFVVNIFDIPIHPMVIEMILEIVVLVLGADVLVVVLAPREDEKWILTMVELYFVVTVDSS